MYSPACRDSTAEDHYTRVIENTQAFKLALYGGWEGKVAVQEPCERLFNRGKRLQLELTGRSTRLVPSFTKPYLWESLCTPGHPWVRNHMLQHLGSNIQCKLHSATAT